MALLIMFEPGMERIDNITGDAAYEACKEIAADIRRNMAPHRKTGALSRSVRARKSKNGGRVYVGTDHWHFIEYGVEPHPIAAHGGPFTPGPKVLVNKNYPGKKRFLGKNVIHPGFHAYMPIRKAFYKKRSMATLVIADKADAFGFTGEDWYVGS